MRLKEQSLMQLMTPLMGVTQVSSVHSISSHNKPKADVSITHHTANYSQSGGNTCQERRWQSSEFFLQHIRDSSESGMFGRQRLAYRAETLPTLLIRPL